MRMIYAFVFFERMKCPQLTILYTALLLQKITIKVIIIVKKTVSSSKTLTSVSLHWLSGGLILNIGGDFLCLTKKQ